MILICLMICVRIIICSGIVSHTVWLPLGKLIHLPCQVAPFIESGSLDEWLNLNEQYQVNQSIGTIVWQNKIGQVVHIGQTLSIKVPLLNPSELSMTQILPDAKPTSDTVQSKELPSMDVDDTGESHNILESRMLKSLTCSLIRSQPVIGTEEDSPKTIKLEISHFVFRIYMQPVIVWSYAIPKPKPDRKSSLKPISDSMYNLIKEWCRSKRNITQQKLNPCKHIFIHHMPTLQMTGSTETIPMKFSTKEYIELTVTIEFSNEPLTILHSPFTKYLSYIHATWKFTLDSHIIRDLVLRLTNPKLSIATRLRAICPPGTQPYGSVPPLEDIRDISTNQRLPKNSSAAALKNWPILCNPCPPGQAPRTPYSFDGCHLCPYGFYLGETKWPASAGCLPCPDGFTTDRIGATSIQECRLYAGTISKWIIDYFLLIFREFEDTILGIKSKSSSKMTTKIDDSIWTRLGQIRFEVWIFMGLYLLLVIWIGAVGVYRLQLYYKLTKLYKKQLRLHLKVAVMGQINLISRIKQRAKSNLITTDELKEIPNDKKEVMKTNFDSEVE